MVCFCKEGTPAPKLDQQTTSTGRSLGFHSKAGNGNVFLHFVGIYLNCQVLKKWAKENEGKDSRPLSFGNAAWSLYKQKFYQVGEIKVGDFYGILASVGLATFDRKESLIP